MILADLKREIKRQARLCYADYGDSSEGYRTDRNNIIRARNAAKKTAGMYWHLDDKEVIPGEYFGTRLVITRDSIDYTAGQYAPTEVYWALEDYFHKYKQQ